MTVKEQGIPRAPIAIESLGVPSAKYYAMLKQRNADHKYYLSLLIEEIKKVKFTSEEVGNLEWESADLEMSFADDHPKEIQAILQAHTQKIIDRLGE